MSPQNQSLLMCAPEFFGVEYVINPWMNNQIGHVDPTLAMSQWQNLHDNLAKLVAIKLLPPQRGLPDLVFTANAGMVLGKTAILSRFQKQERQGEEVFNKQWFTDNGFVLANWPQDLSFEGAGDALLDRGQKLIWAGHGFRSDTTAAEQIEKIYGRKTVPLKLVDPRFYHLDTCLCPLAGGELLYYPPAFDQESQWRIASIVPVHKRIAVSEEDAVHFACNAVDLGRNVFLNFASNDLRNRLKQAGFTAVVTPVGEFFKAGGAVKCLVLKLVEE